MNNNVTSDTSQAGRAFVFGDGIDTDVLAPGLYMKFPIATIAQHCLESIDSSFATTVRPCLLYTSDAADE